MFKRFCDLCEQLHENVPQSFLTRQSTFKEKLCESVGDIFYFYQPTHRSIHERQMLMIPTQCLHKIIDKADEDVTSVHSNNVSIEGDIMTVVHSALICRKQVSEHPGFNGLNVSKQSAQEIVPEMLQLFLHVLMKGQQAVDDFFEKKSSGDTIDDDCNDYDETESDESDDDFDLEDDKESQDTNEAVNESNSTDFFMTV